MDEKRTSPEVNESARAFSGLTDGDLSRKDFLKRTALVAGSLLMAGSLGAIAGCGGSTAGSTQVRQAPGDAPPATQTPQSSPGGQTQGDTQTLTPQMCGYYNDGTCEKTGRPCTNCISR